MPVNAGIADLMPRALLETHGCTLNQADSDIMAGILQSNGIEVNRGEYSAGDQNRYDFIILNTCTVKKATEQRILDKLKTMSNVKKKLIVTGCMASANKDLIERAIGKTNIVSTNNITRIYDAVKAVQDGKEIVYNRRGLEDKAFYLPQSNSAICRISVSEGCLSSCSFCETKIARGPLNSFPEETILRAIKMNVENGAREIQLTSQDIGAYGADTKTNIAELALNACDIEGSFRIRIGMLNPEHLGKYFDELILAYKNEKLYKFIHLPVQSGSNKVLREMERHYTIEEFGGYVQELRTKIPGISIETDIIVGYPSETESDFEETVEMVERLKPTVTNISKFGSRPHAKASKLKQLPGRRIKDRSVRLSRLVKRMQHEEFGKMVGKRLNVLLTERNGASLTGRDMFYLAIAVNGLPEEKIGECIDVEVIDNSYACLIGRQV